MATSGLAYTVVLSGNKVFTIHSRAAIRSLTPYKVRWTWEHITGESGQAVGHGPKHGNSISDQLDPLLSVQANLRP